ncbi:hypothetical protein FRC16_007099 [Serendipita sp. 398]|nr:hypothetical protein FRC16_007099 [Serendipita sp. 398]
MFMQSHTVVGSRVLPYLDQYQTKPILVLGGIGDTCRRIAQDYGFRDVLIPADVFCWNKDIWPLHTPTQEEQQTARRDFDFSEKPIAAAFVFHDPRNWAPDVQILLDIVRYGSQTLPAFVGRGAYPEPRLGQGGFRYAFQSIHTALEGRPYNATILGKPSTETYRHAENMIMNLSSRAYGTNIPKSSIFMIGDNPESDIAGANKAGWNSVLVHTGVFSPGEQTPSHIPTFQARDVEEAVHLALQRVSGQELPLP